MRDYCPARQPHTAGQITRLLAASRRVLEHRIPITKTTLRRIQREWLTSQQIDGVQRFKAVLQLDAVCANVLHRRSAHGARDQRQVLKPREPLRQRPGHAVVPDLASTRLHHPCLGRVVHQPQALDLHLEHHGLHITGQDDVAAAAQHKLGRWGQLCVSQHGQQIGHGLHAHQGLGARSDAKGVPGL
ncbi:hypothetical protein D3C71_1588080 [compost metagenome]